MAHLEFLKLKVLLCDQKFILHKILYLEFAAKKVMETDAITTFKRQLDRTLNRQDVDGYGP